MGSTHTKNARLSWDDVNRRLPPSAPHAKNMARERGRLIDSIVDILDKGTLPSQAQQDFITKKADRYGDDDAVLWSAVAAMHSVTDNAESMNQNLSKANHGHIDKQDSFHLQYHANRVISTLKNHPAINMKELQKFAEKAHTIWNNNPHIATTWGAVLIEMNKFGKARDFLTDSIEKFPEHRSLKKLLNNMERKEEKMRLYGSPNYPDRKLHP